MISAKPPNLNNLSKSLISYHILASFLEPFGFKFQHYFTLICWCLFKWYFSDSFEKWVPKLGSKEVNQFCVWPPWTVPKRIRVANSISYRFCNDFGIHVGAFSMTCDAVVGTCFGDLELAPAPNHGKRFAGFSRVRRLRSPSTRTFGVPFGSVFHHFFLRFGTIWGILWDPFSG